MEGWKAGEGLLTAVAGEHDEGREEVEGWKKGRWGRAVIV